jgi:hypothetical protein
VRSSSTPRSLRGRLCENGLLARRGETLPDLLLSHCVLMSRDISCSSFHKCPVLEMAMQDMTYMSDLDDLFVDEAPLEACRHHKISAEESNYKVARAGPNS